MYFSKNRLNIYIIKFCLLIDQKSLQKCYTQISFKRRIYKCRSSTLLAFSKLLKHIIGNSIAVISKRSPVGRILTRSRIPDVSQHPSRWRGGDIKANVKSQINYFFIEFFYFIQVSLTLV